MGMAPETVEALWLWVTDTVTVEPTVTGRGRAPLRKPW